MKDQRTENNSKGSLNPVTILKGAIKAVPSMKYALAVLGLMAVVAIVTVWRIQYEVAIVGAVILLGLMVPVLIFAKLTTMKPGRLIIPALVMMWSFLLLTVATAFLLVTCAFFQWPKSVSE